MNKNSELIDNFEEILKKQSTNTIPALYSDKAYTNPSNIELIKPRDIIKNVSSKIKAMNSADCVKSGKTMPKCMNKYKKSTFIPVNMLPRDGEEQKNPTNKFETQCVSDTQLINIIQDVEALVGVDRGMTQEFETSFCAEQNSDDCDEQKETNSTQKDPGFCIIDISLKEPDPNKTQHLIQLSQNTEKAEEQNVSLIETETQIHGTQALNDCIDLKENILQLDVLEDVEMPSSPIFNIKPTKKQLVFNLDAFEKFERIAAPIIEESVDFESAKKIINSQLIGKELYIQTDIQIISNEDDEISPILSPILSIEKRKVDNIDLRSEYNKESDKNSDGSDKHILKDEILFSSDEENEYVQKSFHELPFTCALETSFYDRSDVLDKTMYVGFQTASNKSIQIETVSFTKAKSIFDELDNDLSVKGPTLTELVELCDVTDNKIADTNKVTKIDFQNTFKEGEIVTGDFKSPLNEATGSPFDNLQYKDIVETDTGIEEVFKSNFNALLTAPIIDDLKEENVNVDCNFVGFKTANGKLIDVSKEALIKSETIFKDIDAKDTIILETKITQLKTDTEKPINFLNESEDAPRNTDFTLPKINEESKNDAFVKPGDSKRKFEGFKTANNKRIKLSDIALERTRQIFHDIDLNEKDIPMETDHDQEIKIPDTIANDFEESLRIEKNSDQILINNQELHSIDDVILKEFENEEMAHTQFINQKEINDDFIGFKTASNKGISISKEALTKTKNIFQDIDKVGVAFEDLVKENTSNDTKVLKNNPMPTVIGFKTASNKKINISDQALAKTKSVFHDIDSLQFDDQKVTSDCKTKDLVPEKDVPDYVNHPSTSKGFEGFKTANNNIIKISECALSKTENVFKDIDKEDIPAINILQELAQKDFIKPIDYKFQGFKTASNKKVQISTEALVKSKKLFEDINIHFGNEEKGTEIESAFYGFQTASEDIEISKNASDKSKKLLQDLEATTLESKSYKGFQTASKKPVSISAEALAKSKKIFQDIDNESTNFEEAKLKRTDSNSQTNVGFKTASNKADSTSTEALERSEHSFTESVDNKLKNEEDNVPSFQGFQTASNKTVHVSKEALERTKQIFHDEDIFETESKSNFVGFQTASNKKVQVSKEALERTKQIFHDEDMFETESKLNFVGFQTASNKKVQVSKEALERTKQIFHDEDMFETESKLNFVGFQTASNKKVEISKEALEKTKKIFQDEDIFETESKSNFAGFQTASNKKVEISKDALERTKQIFHDEDMFETESKSNFVGFQTASNKKVQVSKEALERTKQIFHDEDMFETESKLNFVGFQTASNKKVQVSKEALERTKQIFHDEDMFETESKLNFVGFQTASNKKVEISIEALEKTKKIFQDEDIFETESKSNFAGFQTASNKKVEISKDALERTKKIFHDEDIFETEGKSNFVGFQTASNKKVEISKDALEKTKKIFHDEDIFETESKSNFVGFQTVSNKQVQESKEALEKTKKIFDDEDIFAIEHKSDFVGFQTASNKKVSISEEAIAKSKKLFENLDEKSNLFDEKVSFQGFQTASKKEVKISEQALAKSKILFQDIDNDSIRTDTKTTGTYEERNLEEKKQSSVFGFKTANNNNIKISEKALEQSRQIFADLGTDTKIKDEKQIKTDFNIENIINTQVINNFEKTLHTEDFMKDKTPNKSKRSGSPILSCPKAKRRKKFEIPYSQQTVKNLNEVITKTVEKDIQTTENIFNYDTNYKKNKKYSLKDLEILESEHKNKPKKLDPYILKFDYENLLSFEFIEERNDVDNTKWTTEDIKNNFLNSINKKLIPEGWIQNHLKLILWKLMSYEIKFPNTMQGICTVRNVMHQLKYRYDKELYNAVRPALRKIMEKDDVATKTMVLCVVEICGDGVSGDNATNNIELLLTDGWYCIKAVTDKMLTKLIRDQKIVVGTKIVTNGAELLNCDQGVSPWENTTAIRLKLFGNSTRRARWHARLGYHGAAAILSDLSTVKPEGGKVSRLRAFVCRVYPALYIDKFEDGSTVTRSERLEHLHQMKYEAERQASLEKIYEEVEKEFYDQSNLSQTISLPNSTSKREKLLQDIQTRVQEKMEKCGLDVTRNVVPLTKVRVAGVEDTSMKVTKATLSIWKPNDAIMEMIKEGSWIEIMNVVPTAVRYSELQISAGRQSVFNRSKYKESDKDKPYTKSLRRICYAVKELTKNPSMITEYNEIDIVGLIFQIDPSIKEFDSKKHQFQNVFLTDEDKNIICVNFWGGLKKFGFENVLDTGQIVSCTNLQKRAGNTRKNIPQYRVTEFSYFTKTPKSEDARKIIEDLTKKWYGVDRERFCEDCAVLKNNYSAVKLQYNNENVSPYRFQNVDVNLSRNKIFIDSPLAAKAKNDDNLNLTGLDFESTFKQTDTQDLSPKTLLRKKQVKEKIAKLKMYGEPPPLSPINIINKSKTAGNAFKSPLVSKSDVPSVASEKKILPIEQNIEKEEIQCSPVLNRTYVKRNVNPVKLNFSNSVAMDENNVSDVVDNFAEDFESSPPLSLD